MLRFLVCTQQTSGMTALYDLSTTPERNTSASSSVEPTEAPAEQEQSPPQCELFPVASSVSPAITQPSLDAETAEETDPPPESGK